jgi:hypothetical protein
MRAVVVGAGAVGVRAARQLASTDGVDGLRIIERDEAKGMAVADSLGPVASATGELDGQSFDGADVVLLATPSGHRRLAEAALARGAHVVSVSDDIDEVRALLALDAEARERALSVVVGAGFAPGLTCVLARLAAKGFETVEEIHVAKSGTAGPACARQHHRALRTEVLDWRAGAWVTRRGGSGRQLAYFPEPVGGLDCYRAAVPDALLLAPAFPGVRRVTGRMAASRRDRLTSRLPMLRPPHPEGVIGGVRVELRGRRASLPDVRVLGAVDRPGIAAGAVAAVAAAWAADGRLTRPGAGGLAALLDEPSPFLRELARRGVKAAVFEGSEPVPA